MNRKFLLFILILGFFYPAERLLAATIVFNGAGDGSSWEDPANWDSGLVPANTDDVIINGSNTVIICQQSVSISTLRLQGSARLMIASSGRLTLNQGSVIGEMILLDGTAKLTIDGTLNIIDGPACQIESRNRSSITNNGFMNLVSAGGDVIELFNSSSFINNGVVLISDSGNEGIELTHAARFFNNGSIDISGNDSGEGIKLDENSGFYNFGSISIAGLRGEDGIKMDDNGSEFYNKGTISIHARSGSGEGISLDDGLFVNEDGGVIDISGIKDNGIYLLSGGEFNNEGTVTIQINVDGSDAAAVELGPSSIFRNFNILNITMSADRNASALNLEGKNGKFINDVCGVVNMLSPNKIKLSSDAFLQNNGVMTSLYSGIHANSGTLTNDGQITAPNGFAVSSLGLVGAGTVTNSGAVPAQSACNIKPGDVGCSGTTPYDADQGPYTHNFDSRY